MTTGCHHEGLIAQTKPPSGQIEAIPHRGGLFVFGCTITENSTRFWRFSLILRRCYYIKPLRPDPRTSEYLKWGWGGYSERVFVLTFICRNQIGSSFIHRFGMDDDMSVESTTKGAIFLHTNHHTRFNLYDWIDVCREDMYIHLILVSLMLHLRQKI